MATNKQLNVIARHINLVFLREKGAIIILTLDSSGHKGQGRAPEGFTGHQGGPVGQVGPFVTSQDQRGPLGQVGPPGWRKHCG